MRYGQTVRQLSRLILRIILALIILLVCCAGLEESRNWRVERRISEFRAAPSQEKADRLVALLDRWVPNAGQGERILALLLWPEITIRPLYPVGEPASVTVEHPYRLSFQRVGMVFTQQAEQCQNHLTVDSKQRHEATLTTAPETFRVHRSPPKPGTYYSLLKCDCMLTNPSIWDRIPGWLPCGFGGRHEVYVCRFDVPIEITAVATTD